MLASDIMKTKKKFAASIVAVWLIILGSGFCSPAAGSVSTFAKWEAIGRVAATQALEMITKADVIPSKDKLIVLTNAGFAEADGEATSGALDGLAAVTGASRGRSSLLEIHSAPWSPLWFALYDKSSGFCTYLEVDPSEAAKIPQGKTEIPQRLFRLAATERIDAEYLYQHSAEYQTKFESKIFGGNAFRIITIANAVAASAPQGVVRAFEFHDHYCPGVISGIFMARYLKEHFPPGKSGYFVHTVDPWCKEDALLVLLNTTPGKRSYAVSYPTADDRVGRIPEAKNASTIVYRQNRQTSRWEGLVLGFTWVETSCPKIGNALIEKLCADLWYLDRMEKPEDFVKVIKRFELPDGISPRDWARPGIDPLQMLGLAKGE